MRRLALMVCLWMGAASLAGAQTTFSGYVLDALDREILLGATVQDTLSGRGAVTNAYGFFTLTVPGHRAILSVSYIGFEPALIAVDSSRRHHEILLRERSADLGAIIVSDDRIHRETVESVRMGTLHVRPDAVNRIPTFAGEADLLKVFQLMPGVTQGNEATSGMYVRGGTDDQNLVLLDDAVVYNIGHLFGFFSVFNNDAIQDVNLIKGAFPARHGGRLSSVMDVRMKDGSLERWNATGGVGLLTSRITVDGPLIEDRMSFMVSGRRTYIDQVLRLAGTELPYYFYDVNAKLNYRLSDADRLYVSSYFGDDILDVADPDSDDDLGFGFSLGNAILTARWNHVYASGRTFSNVTLHQSRFAYDISGRFVDNSVLITSRIQDHGLKADWETVPDPSRRYHYGFAVVTHGFRPNVVSTSGDVAELVGSSASPFIRSTETALHAGVDRDLTERIRVEAGLRHSAAFSGRTYHGFEPRLAARYQLTSAHALKASYSLMRQYMHRVSSSAIALPTDLWYPVTEGVGPQLAHQISVGYFGSDRERDLTWSVEWFAKRMRDLIDYKEGARLILNDRFESELLRGDGVSRGMEVLLRKHQGRSTGWIGYTWAKTERQFDGLNGGNPFPDRYDRRHSISAVWMVDLSDRIHWSMNWVYLSGSRITAQTGQYLMPNASLTGVDLVPIYSTRNAIELAASHRMDVNLVVKGRRTRFGDGEWHFSAYNFYNRAAPYRISIASNGKTLEYVQQGLFGVFPSIAYHFRFSSP
jgi:hypothetical protein